MLVLLSICLILQETIPPVLPTGDNWFQYGLAGALIVLMSLLLKYFLQKEKTDKDREAELAKQRSDMYREDNKLRDERWCKTLEHLSKVLEKVDKDGSKYIDATKEMVDKFVELVNKVMEQTNFQTQVLVELKTIITKLPDEFKSEKQEIISYLESLTLNYELKHKDEK